MSPTMFAPNLSLTVAPEPDLLLLDSYIRLVECKRIDDRRNVLQPSEQRMLETAVNRTRLLARQKYGDEQAARVTKLGEKRGDAAQNASECEARVRHAIAALEDALDGRAPPVSNDLRTRLEHYCWVAGGYYVDVTCKHLSKRQRYAFWQAVVDRHNELLYHSMLGTSEAKHAAELAPNAMPACGRETKKFVRSAYTEVKKLRGGVLARLLDRLFKV